MFIHLVPGKPVLSSVQYNSDNQSITIKAADTPVTAETGSLLDFYKLISTGTPTSGATSVTQKDNNMIISALEAGTVYSLKFKALISCADGPIPSVKESDQTSDVFTACTGNSRIHLRVFEFSFSYLLTEGNNKFSECTLQNNILLR